MLFRSTDAAGNVTGVKPYVPYTGERVAPFTPEQIAYQTEVAGMKTPGGFGEAARGIGLGERMGFGAGATGLTQAFGYTPTAISGGTFSPAAAAYYEDPYQKAVTDIAVREAERQRDLAKTAGMTGAITRGTFGGARQALLQAEQGRNAAQQIADIRTKGAEQAYLNAQQQFNADVARQQQAQQYAAGLGQQIGLAGLTAGLQGSQALGALGAQQQTADLSRLQAQDISAAQQQALQQQQLNQAYQDWQTAQNYPKSQLEYLNNILRGNAGALGSTQVAYTPAPSNASQLDRKSTRLNSSH